MEQQELIYRIQVMEQHMQQMQQQSQAIESGISELESLNRGLDEIPNSEGKEILAQIGKGIYVKAKLSSKEILVNVGEGNFVGKSVEETKKLIQRQIEKLNEMKKDLEKKMEMTNQEFMKLIEQYQNPEK